MQSDFTVSDVLERLKTDKVFFREFMEAIVELIDLLKDRKTAQRQKGKAWLFRGFFIYIIIMQKNSFIFETKRIVY